MRAASEIPLDAAILDINLDGQSVYPVVDLLMAKGVPTAFISGYGAESVDRRYEHIPLMQKPIDRQVLLDLLNLVGKKKTPLVQTAKRTHRLLEPTQKLHGSKFVES